jgi:hypothetical protein
MGADPRRWLLWVGLAALVAFFLVRREPEVKKANGECLSNAECLKVERCVVTPKGDGFATLGRCGEKCAEDLECPAHWRCEFLADEGAFLLTKPPKEGGLSAKACVPGAREP